MTTSEVDRQSAVVAADSNVGRLEVARRVATGEAAVAAAAGGIAMGLAAVVLKLWRAQLDVPFAYLWDANQFAMYIKTILDHGWYFRNENLGAPFGQQLFDYPNVSTDNLQAFAVKLLGYLFSDWATVMNVWFLLTFPLVAVAAYLVLRALGAGRGPSLVCAVLYALLPYHFARGEHHLFYSAYFAVPIGVYLALTVFAGRPLFARRHGDGPLAYVSRRTLLTIGLCLVVATASGAVYYALFTVLLLAAGIVVAALSGRGRRALAHGGAAIAVIVAVLAANLAPTFVYRAVHGPNPVAGQRSWTESEYQGLKLTHLVLPIEHHRVGALANLSGRYADFQRSVGAPREAPALQRPDEWESAHLGIVGTIGFAVLLGAAFAALAGRRSPPAVYRHAAFGTLLAFLVATVGGVSVLFAAGVTPQFRSWNRVSILIAFLALLAVALLLTSLGRRWQGTRNGRLAFGAVLALVLGLGVLDQTSPAYVPPYASTAESFRSDAAFVQEVERELGADASVYQLPYVPFPDGGLTHRLTEYDLVRGYFHSDSLRWSFGAMSGRPEDWQAELSQRPLALQVQGAAAAGFDGVHVDRRGYADEARSLEHTLAALLGEPLLESRDGQLLLFDLRPLREELREGHAQPELERLREATVRPLRLEWPAGAAVDWEGERPWRSTGAELRLVIVNPADEPRRTAFEVRVATRGGEPATAVVRYPDGRSTEVGASAAGARVERDLELAPGRNVIELSAGAPVWVDASVLDERFGPFESGRAAGA